MSISWLALPALLAFFVKVFLIIISKDGAHYSRLFLAMVLSFACHNLAEVLGVMEFFQDDRSDLMVRWYYAAAVFALASIVLYAHEVSRGRMLGRIEVAVVGVLVFSLVVTILFTDYVIAGATPISYSLTAVRGNYYNFFDLYSVCSYVVIFYLLISGYRKAKDNITQLRCGYTILALMPLVISACIMMFVMSRGVAFNALTIMPIATTLFLLVTIFSERAHGLTDIRRHIPYSLERRTSKQIMHIFSKYANDDMSYRDALNEIERLLITHKHNKKGGVVSYTAQAMDLPRSTLYSIAKRLGLELNDTKN